ncbi:MAG TPA: trigger factor [Candidatus Dormibacteraeota bacterium]|nr:trigger factor [Candidatus Dormibacteraeota bacterium]
MTPSDVSVSTETLPGSRIGVMIEVPPARVEEAFRRTLDRLGRRVKVQGFRPGKAPQALIEAKLDPDTLRSEVAETLVGGVLSEALRDHEIRPIDQPQVEIQELDRGRPGRFLARVSVLPKVELPDLSTLHIDLPHSEVTDELLQTRIDVFRERFAEIEPVEREVQEGDIVVGDLKVYVDEEELPEEARAALELPLDGDQLVPELKEALLGRSIGDVVNADVHMSAEHENPRLKDKDAGLEVTIQGLKEKRVPELDDELAKQLSDGAYETADAYRESVREELVENAARRDKLEGEERALTAVAEAVELELPEALIDWRVDQRIENLTHQLSHQGLRLERYLEYMGKTEAGYRAEIRGDSATEVKVDLVLDEVGDQFEIDPAGEEVLEELRENAGDLAEHTPVEQLEKDEGAVALFRRRLIRRRTLEQLAELLSQNPAPETENQAETEEPTAGAAAGSDEGV